MYHGLAGLKVVVADDSRTIRTQLKRFLAPTGLDVLEASTGVEALELIERHQPQLVILDINMPELDGYGVCLKMKEMDAPTCHVPVLFLTSISSHALELLGTEMGTYLRKPVDPVKLLQAVSDTISAAQQAAS